jgi:threonine aldolase
MYSFKDDYSEGAHPKILEALVTTNTTQMDGYGMDPYTTEAITLIKKKIGQESIDVHLFPGGTQTNLTTISSFLRPHEAAISANTGHILGHEAGAIEATGHKIISMQSNDGKLTPNDIQSALDMHPDEHMVKPRLVYLSNPTEIGTIYSQRELKAISDLCKSQNLYLYVDGARMGSALTSRENDLTLGLLTEYTDAFYIGGTKNGALLGEALVISSNVLKEDFRYFIKQKGALMAKGRVLGIQFAELFRNDLIFELGSHANSLAEKLSQGIESLGYSFLIHSPTNQIFPIFPNQIIQGLKENYGFHFWQAIDSESSAVRLVTSWATPESAIDSFLKDLKVLSQDE